MNFLNQPYQPPPLKSYKLWGRSRRDPSNMDEILRLSAPIKRHIRQPFKPPEGPTFKAHSLPPPKNLEYLTSLSHGEKPGAKTIRWRSREEGEGGMNEWMDETKSRIFCVHYVLLLTYFSLIYYVWCMMYGVWLRPRKTIVSISGVHNSVLCKYRTIYMYIYICNLLAMANSMMFALFVNELTVHQNLKGCMHVSYHIIIIYVIYETTTICRTNNEK
jgi:hypothetical protein